MFRLFRNAYHQLPITPEQVKQHLEALSSVVNNDAHEKMFDHLYDSLTILDSKSASLLQFNSVLVAVFTILVSVQPGPVLWVLGGAGLALTLISCYLLLSVVWVHWSTTDHLVDGNTHEMKLMEVRRERTIGYRWAWNFSRAALVALVGVIIHSAYLGTLPRNADGEGVNSAVVATPTN